MRVFLAAILLGGLLSGGTPIHAQNTKSATVALAHEPDRLYNPATLAGQLVANLVFDPLVGLDDQMNPYPALAATIPTPDNASGPAQRRRRRSPSDRHHAPASGRHVERRRAVHRRRRGLHLAVDDEPAVRASTPPSRTSSKASTSVDDFTVNFTYLSANEARALDPERYKDQGDRAGRRPAVHVRPVRRAGDLPAPQAARDRRRRPAPQPTGRQRSKRRTSPETRSAPDRTCCRAGTPAAR